MKYFIMTIWAALMLFMIGCSQEEIPSSSEESTEIIPVKISLGGDLIQTEESPLSRAETEATDLYGIQVYKDGEGFAGGLFDNTGNITINLLAGGTYRFVCTAIKDGKNLLYSDRYGIYTAAYPFKSSNGFFSLKCDNLFTYKDSDNMRYLDYSGVTMSTSNGTGYTYCNQIDRFYGELDNYTPSVNGIVNLELKRVSFGLKFKVYNIKEGTVSFACENDKKTFVSVSNLATSYETESAIYSMYDIYSAWQYADYDYTEPLTLTVTWDREGGLISDTWTKIIQVKRNVMNTIRIKMGTDEKEDTGIGVTPEEGEEEEEEEEILLG